MSKHTPGPWETIDGAEVYPTSGPTSFCPLARIDGPWSGSSLYVNASEAKANGRLIASAPELLESLKTVVVMLQDLIESCDVDESNACKRAAEVISKAEGLTP